MGYLNFVSPGAMAGNAIEELLMQRAAAQRQALLDALGIQEKQAQNARAEAQLELQRQQEERLRQGQEASIAEQARVAERQAGLDADVRAKAAAERNAAIQKAGVRNMVMLGLKGGGYTPETAAQTMYAETGDQIPLDVLDPGRAQRKDERDFQQQQELERLRANLRPDPVGPQSPVAVIGDDGQPVLVRPGDAIGRRPASSREQGRPVTSGDANRIADLDTSLNDLAVLEKEITGLTGTGSAIGAAIPMAITDLTGIGAESKARQALIDRVKQVIGKALEGGVLRKEDEAKYAKILPVISDTPSVAASKIKGLRQAIEQRRATTLEDYGAAGYDVSKFNKAETPEQRAKRLYDELSR